MTEPTKKISLSQSAPPTEDHGAKVLREKIGDVRTIKSSPADGVMHTGTLAPDQKQLEEKIVAALQTVFDPEIPLNIYDLGLVYRLDIAPTNAVKVQMTLTAPGCPVAGDIVADVKRKIEAIPEVPAVEVQLVWEPAWTRERLTEAAKLELGML